MTDPRDHSNSQQGKLWSAVFYGISSILVIFTNKWLLTAFHFPHFKFVAATQFVATSVILFVLAMFKKVDIPFITPAIFKEIMPISLMFLGNVIFGLGSTKALNIPMFTALRRFSILMTMMGEWWMLDSKPHSNVVISVSLMVGGALLAAMYDLAYDTEGYIMVFLNNIFTAMNGVWMKKASMSGKCSKMGVLFYNSLFSALIMSAYFIGEHNYYNNRASSANSLYGVAIAQTPTTNALTTTSSGSSLSGTNSGASPVHRFLSAQRYLADLPAPSLRGHGASASASMPAAHSIDSVTTLSELEKAKQRLQALSQHISSESDRYAELKEKLSNTHSQGLAGTTTTATEAEKTLFLKQQAAAAQLGIPFQIIQGGQPPQGQKAVPGISTTPAAVGTGEEKHSHAQSTLSLVWAYPHWDDWHFIAMLLGTCCMGSVLNYAIFLCTTRNSALTTAVVGTMKNVFTTYLGMMLFSDYTFTWVNFLGINISIMGSLYYTYCTMKS